MNPQLEADILAASQSLRVPGSGERRVLAPAAIERLAEACEWPRWKVEALALELGIAPLHYLRNLAQYGPEGQVKLLRSSAALVGSSPALDRALELLATAGVGRLSVMAPFHGREAEGAAEIEARRTAGVGRNRNASPEYVSRTLSVRGGNPSAALQNFDVVACCLDEAVDEQLVQFACRMNRTPLVVAAVEGATGQCVTVLPGDAGVALVYKPSHPHLESSRRGTEVEERAALMVGTWVAEQVLRVLLGEGELLRDRLLFADLDTGQIVEWPLA